MKIYFKGKEYNTDIDEAKLAEEKAEKERKAEEAEQRWWDSIGN